MYECCSSSVVRAPATGFQDVIGSNHYGNLELFLFSAPVKGWKYPTHANTNLSEDSCSHNLHHKRIPCPYYNCLRLDYTAFCSSGKLVYWFSCMYSLALLCPKLRFLCTLRCCSLPLWNLASNGILPLFQIQSHREILFRVGCCLGLHRSVLKGRKDRTVFTHFLAAETFTFVWYLKESLKVRRNKMKF